VRYWVPESWEPADLFDDAAVGDVWDRESSAIATTAEEALVESKVNVFRVAYILTQTMISGLVGQPDSFSVGGEYSESRGAAINLLINRLNDLRRLRDDAIAILEGTAAVTTSLLCRPNYLGR
jgi:hypothetical protein